ncbi:MAG: hypothetical protein AAFY03_02985, partial [Pseudomonadota bacterium]
IAAVISAVVSVGAALLSYDASSRARQAQVEAQRLAERQFEAETTIEILDRAYSAMLGGTEAEAIVACSYLAALSDLEQTSRPKPHFITDFIRSAALRRDGPNGCQLQFVAVATEALPEVEAGGVVLDALSDGADYPETFGRWHALVASYLPENCTVAREQVARFARLLRDSSADGLPIYVARSTATDYLAVTVDAGESEALARAVRAAVRTASAGLPDGTGHDSFVARDRAWSLDPVCQSAAIVGLGE